MKAVGRLMIAAGMLWLLSSAPAHAVIVIDFEEGVGLDRTEINTQYEGITFVGATTGESWLYGDHTTGGYNTKSWPSGDGSGIYWLNDDVFAWTSEAGGNGMVTFDNQDATFLQLNYCSFESFYVEAYDADDNLLDSAMGPANTRNQGNESGPGTLRVDAPMGELIAYVMVHDTGNYWLVDNVETDASGIVGPNPVIPEPSTLLIWSLLSGLGIAVAWWRRK